MYGYIYLYSMVNVGKYTIHGWHGQATLGMKFKVINAYVYIYMYSFCECKMCAEKKITNKKPDQKAQKFDIQI